MKVYVVVEIVSKKYSPYTPKVFGVFDNKQDADACSSNSTNVWCEVVETEMTVNMDGGK